MQHFFILWYTCFIEKLRVLLLSALIFTVQPALTTGMPPIIDVTMWSQQFDASARFVKENESILIPIILGICSFNPTVKVLWQY